MGLAAHWKKTLYYLQRNGLKHTCYAVLERLQQMCDKTAVYEYHEPEEAELIRQRALAQDMVRSGNAPLFSILVPLYRTPQGYLKDLVESVLNQTYPKLELILADATEDDSVEQRVRLLLAEESDRWEESRIRYHRLSHNGGISDNTNEALQYATGEYIGLLDHDDVLTPDALYEMVSAILQNEQAGKRPLLLYSDEDKCNSDRSVYFDPHYKTDFNRDLLLSNNYICHFLVMDRELFEQLKLRKAYDGAQDYDLVLRAAARIGEETKRIVHIPKVLYHWRCHSGSTAENPQSKLYAYEAGKRALQELADRMGWQAEAVHLRHLGFYGLRYHPSLLKVRNDVAAVGGSLYKGGRLAAGAYGRNGQLLYEGLRKGFSGYMHRGVLIQNAAAVDIRLIAVKAEYRALFEQVTGVAYVTTDGQPGREDVFDWRTLPDGTDYRRLSMELGKALQKEGLLICWDPSWQRRL